MRKHKLTWAFKKDVKLQKRRSKDMNKLIILMNHIAIHGDAPELNRPHDLSGNFAWKRECHIESDWLLIYVVNDNSVIFYATWTHSDLF